MVNDNSMPLIAAAIVSAANAVLIRLMRITSRLKRVHILYTRVYCNA